MSCPCQCHGQFDAACSIEGGCGHLHSEVGVGRPGYACVLHGPPLDGSSWEPQLDGYRVCEDCRSQLYCALEEIAERYLRLDPAPGAGAMDGTRGAPGFGSRAPARDHVIVMMDRRSTTTAKVWVGGDGRVHREDTNPPLSVWQVLHVECAGVAMNRDCDMPAPTSTVGDLVAYLVRHVDWLSTLDMVIGFAQRLDQIIRQLRDVTGAKRVKVGRCPVPDEEGIPCAEPLYAPADAALEFTVDCDGCGARWTRAQFAELSRQIGQAAA